MPTATTVDELFRFALRAGDMLLRNGAPSATVTQVMLTLAATSGYPATTANVTMGQITLSYSPDDDERPVTRVTTVGTAGLDIHALTVLEHIVEDVVTGDISVAEGHRRLSALESGPAQRPFWKIVGAALMGAGFAWLLGAGVATCAIAALCAGAVDATVAICAKHSLPPYYARMLAGAMAVAVAAALVAYLPLPLHDPGAIIVAALVTQLAGSSSVSAIQDLLTGWLLTACGRLIEAILLTVGLAVGALLGVVGATRLGVRLDIEKTGSASTDVWQTMLAATLISSGFALLSHARWRHLPTLAVVSATGQLALYLIGMLGVSTYSATGVAAGVLGVLSVAFARPAHLPMSGFLDVSIVSLAPGMALYQGFAGLATHDAGASSHLFEATAVALSIGSGAVLGQFIASRSLWTARRVQRRVAEREADGTLDDRQFAAEGLATPDFRRPFIDAERHEPAA